MPHRIYVKQKVRESLDAVCNAKEKLQLAWEAADKLVISGPNKTETIRVGKLSPREREVLALFASGQNYKQIAGTLHVSPETVKVHRRHIIRHLKTADIATLTRIAIRNGLVSLEENKG